MPRKPDIRCAGCGKMMWRGKGALPEGQATCRDCRAERMAFWRANGRPCVKCGRVTARWRKPSCLRCELSARTDKCDVHSCDRPVLAKGLCSTHYAWHYRIARGEVSGSGAWITPKRRLSIYERDGWVCQLCELPIAVDAPVQDDFAPSLDHIIPRSLGGGHESENLRLAHRVCNSRRGAREVA